MKPPSPSIIPSLNPQHINQQFAPLLIEWQIQFGRHDLPWQNTKDPYRVWLSEIMLQQTQVATVLAYYKKFVSSFPTVTDLAHADEDQVMQLWQGLGYYTRARNLYACAKIIAKQFQGQFPSTASQLVLLPGIGPSTASAIAAFCFGENTHIMDGNVKRVISRVLGVLAADNLHTHKQLLSFASQLMVTSKQSEHLRINFHDAITSYTQGLMDLGSSICKPKLTHCNICPFQTICSAHLTGRVHEIPLAKIKKIIPRVQINWVLYVLNDQVWLERRPAKGIWANMFVPIEVGTFSSDQSAQSYAFINLEHKLTHRHLYIDCACVLIDQEKALLLEQNSPNGSWVLPHEVACPKPVTLIFEKLSALRQP